MSRTLSQIYDEIVAYKDTQTPISDLQPHADTEAQLMSDLNSGSKVAIWRLWAYIVAAAIYVHETIWDLFKAEVEGTIARSHAGTPPWYRDRILAFQYGDNIAYNSATGKYGYAVIDASKQIVKHAAVVEANNGVVIFKAAKEDSNGNLEGLAAMEQDSLISYLKKIRFAGTRFQLVSGAGDFIRIEASVYFDAIFTEATVRDNVEMAIQAYIEGLPFNGEMLLSKLVDAVQAVEGVNDITLEKVETKANAGDAYDEIDRNHVPLYGYYQFDDTFGNSIGETVTYIAQ